MSDTFRKVKSGDKLRIPAATYNAFIDTALDHQSHQRNVSSTPQAAMRSSGMILVRNDTGKDINRYCVLGINGPIIKPGDNLDSFKNKVAVTGVVPRTASHLGNVSYFNTHGDDVIEGRFQYYGTVEKPAGVNSFNSPDFGTYPPAVPEMVITDESVYETSSGWTATYVYPILDFGVTGGFEYTVQTA